MDPELILLLVIIVVTVLLVVLALAFYRKSDLGKSLTLMYIMRKHGPNSIVTIDLLQDIVRRMLARDGIDVTDISLVNEMGNRYHGILTSEGETHEMTVIADRSGTLHYQILD